jgi:hypothetical protein
MIGAQRSISDLRWARNASGCALSEETVSAPAAASRLLTSGSCSAFCRAADSVSSAQRVAFEQRLRELGYIEGPATGPECCKTIDIIGEPPNVLNRGGGGRHFSISR